MRRKIFMILFLLIGFPTFADTQQIDIAPGANVLCNANILGTTSGTVRLRANFVPEDIDLKWYDGNTRVNTTSASNTCTYDTAINLPTNPTKTGYTFKGWKAIPGTRIQYIESTGTQKINTGIYANENTAIETKFINTSSQDLYTTKMIIADRDLTYSSYMLGVNERTRALSAIGGLKILYLNYWQTNQEYTVYMDKDTGQTVNGVTTQWGGHTDPLYIQQSINDIWFNRFKSLWYCEIILFKDLAKWHIST